jgi:hypothetical protein
MKTLTKWLVLLLIFGFIISGCSPRAKYERMLKKELASGVRYDSLFLGLYFGMPEKEFYGHCWKLNHNGLIRQGETNTTAEFQLKNELKYESAMDFYPKFNQGKIFEMPVSFKYKGWAPWNKKLSSDNLLVAVKKWYEKTYGKGFIEVKHPLHGTAYVKINGNRRITIFKENDVRVWAVFTDMSVQKGWNETVSQQENTQNDTIKSIQNDTIKSSK